MVVCFAYEVKCCMGGVGKDVMGNGVVVAFLEFYSVGCVFKNIVCDYVVVAGGVCGADDGDCFVLVVGEVVVRNGVGICPEGDCNGAVCKVVVSDGGVVLCCFDAGGVKARGGIFKTDV